MWVGVPLWTYFSMWAVVSLHVEAIFSVCCGGYFWSAPPWFFFAATPIIVITFFLLHIYIFLPDRGGLNFLGNFFFFEGGGWGLREGGRLLSTFGLFFREHAGPGGRGYRIMIVMWEAEILTIWGGGGGGAEVIYSNWCWGGGGGKFFGQIE